MTQYDEVDAAHGHDEALERDELSWFGQGVKVDRKKAALVGAGFVAAVGLLVGVLQVAPEWALNAFVWMFGA